MSKLPDCYGIIPARYASTRFPGKPLAEIHGKPMFWYVFDRASQCRELLKVVLATDDERILAAAEKLNVPALMTRTDHVSGTDRVLEAAELLNIPSGSVVVNIQGDEPAVDPAMLSELIKPFTSPEIVVTTPARPIPSSQAANPDMVKVVFTKTGQALYFSRSAVPHTHRSQNGEYYGHVGVYAFRMETLKRFVALKPSRLELAEKLEQLRLLENDIPVHVVLTDYRGMGVDRPEDIKTVCDIIQPNPDTPEPKVTEL
jgi:3-deoxy-manno-octulosonate cytidylyltransferase (CMP-KDO synthetase)